MSQQVIYYIEMVVVVGFVLAVFVRGSVERRRELRGARKAGCVAGGCLVPIICLAVTMDVARSAADMGGPLFWPILAGLGGMGGFAVGTVWFVLRKRK
jgi:hypothetical protein